MIGYIVATIGYLGLGLVLLVLFCAFMKYAADPEEEERELEQ